MLPTYTNAFNSERIVELCFIIENFPEFKNKKVLDVGGIPTYRDQSIIIDGLVKENNINYKICDFRGGDYQGDFVTLDIPEKFDGVIFLSSLEHFPQCTEGDLKYRNAEDRKGFLKALSILNDEGLILLTVPFGKYRWQSYHQNYDHENILKLVEGSKILEENVYVLKDNIWTLTNESETKEIIYDNKCHCVACYKLRKL